MKKPNTWSQKNTAHFICDISAFLRAGLKSNETLNDILVWWRINPTDPFIVTHPQCVFGICLQASKCKFSSAG